MTTRTTSTSVKQKLLAILSSHIGKDNGIKGKELAAELDCVPRQLRVAIKELRNEGQHICGKPECGYFIAANLEELEETCEFLHARAMASLTQVSAMKRVSIPTLIGQQRFTQ